VKTVKLVLLSFAICIGLILWLLESIETKTNVTTFCAYGRTFIEFTENGKSWGTTLLDNDGRPVRCTNEEQKESTKGII
jgi:hypothetical protein